MKTPRLPIPIQRLALNSALAEAFVRQHVGRLEVHCDDEIRALASGRFGEVLDTWKVRYGSGIAPLFSALMEHCHDTGGSLLLPTGAYGQFAACARFHGVETRALPTEATHGFKMTADGVRESIAGTEKPWLFLNAPIVNPSGAVYRPQEVEAILSEVRQAGGKVIIDSVFAGLELTTAARYEVEDWPATVILGGVSKEFAAAGIRFGYAVTNNRELHDALEARRLDRPHSTHFFAIKRLLGKQLCGDPSLTEDLEQQRQSLRERAIAMAEALSESGWEVMPPEGGLFLIARPAGLLGRKVQYITPQGPMAVELTADNVAEAAFYKSNLLFNGPDWTGIPGFCRFVLSVNDLGFETALARIRDFARITAG
jgi:methionine S-methyltransferase